MLSSWCAARWRRHRRWWRCSADACGKAAGGWMTPKKQLIPHRHFKDGQWNAYRILAVGPNIKTWINGVAISDQTHAEKYALYPRGFIGLQVHEDRARGRAVENDRKGRRPAGFGRRKA